MKDIVFILPLTPNSHLTPLRKLLRDNTLNSLRNQTSSNWEALLVGELDKTEGNIRYIPAVSLDPTYQKTFRVDLAHTDKHFKVDVAMQHINKEERKPKYIVKLDDDDLISPSIVSIIEKSGDIYDCFTDYYQVLYNVTNGKVTFINFPWMANTTFHKYTHANIFLPEFGHTVINCAHTAIHIYYKDKQVWYSPKLNPVYVRIHSPTSLNVSSTLGKGMHKEHAKKFGFWHYKSIPEYEPYFTQLASDYESLTSVRINRTPTALNYITSLSTYKLDKWFSNFFPRLGNKLRRQFK